MKEEKLLEILKADLNSISTKDISIEDCNIITLNLWNLSNKDYKQCISVLKSLKSKTNKVQTFKKISENFLLKLSSKDNLGPWSKTSPSQTSSGEIIRKHSNSSIKLASFDIKKLTPKVIGLTLLRLIFSFLFFGAAINSIYKNPEAFITALSFNSFNYFFLVLFPLLIELFVGYVCLRAAFENSNVWTRKTVNNFRAWDLSYWKKQADTKSPNSAKKNQIKTKSINVNKKDGVEGLFLFFKRFLNGYFSLKVTFWYFYFIPNIIYLCIREFYIYQDENFLPSWPILIIVLSYKVLCIIAIWNSSGKYTGKKIWFYLVRIFIAVEVILTFIKLLQIIPILYLILSR